MVDTSFNKSQVSCLSHVAFALFGFLPGSGSLECDIGGFSDIIGQRCVSLEPGMVEASMVLNLNKDLLLGEGGESSKNWRQIIPRDLIIQMVINDKQCVDDEDGEEQEANNLNLSSSTDKVTVAIR